MAFRVTAHPELGASIVAAHMSPVEPALVVCVVVMICVVVMAFSLRLKISVDGRT
jgi:Tfp pilus assembly protein PilO